MKMKKNERKKEFSRSLKMRAKKGGRIKKAKLGQIRSGEREKKKKKSNI